MGKPGIKYPTRMLFGNEILCEPPSIPGVRQRCERKQWTFSSKLNQCFDQRYITFQNNQSGAIKQSFVTLFKKYLRS